MPAKKGVKKAKKPYIKRSPYWLKKKGVTKMTVIRPEKEIEFPHEKVAKEVSARHLGITQIVPTVTDIVIGKDITLSECSNSLIRWMLRTKPSLKTLKASLLAMIATKGLIAAETASDFLYMKKMMKLLGMDDEPAYFKKDKLLKAKALLFDDIEE